MADIPSNLSYGTVTGRFLLAYADGNDSGSNPDAVPAKGTVYFTPSPNYIKDVTASPAPVTILPASVECALDADGYVVGYGTDQGVRLIATDDPQGNPVDWTWQVEFRLTDAGGNPVRTIPNFSFELPGGTTVDLTSVMPVTDSNGTYYLVGPTGPANELSVGTVSTGNAGTSVAVTITGDAPSQTINFTIPKGDKGDKGDTGDQGPIGETGATGLNWQGAWSALTDYVNDDAVYYNSSSWFASGDPTVGEEPTLSSAHWYPLALQGATGNTGPTNVLSVGTVTTGAAGSSAEVGITGSAPSQTINFTIPKGDKGDKGNTGDTGPQGPAGSLSSLSATAPIMYNSGTSTLSFDSTYLGSIDGGTA